MRSLFIITWLFVPIAAAAYHYGPGQEQVALDQAGAHVETARAHLSAGESLDAVAAFENALQLLPKAKQAEAQRLRLEQAKAQMECSQLPEARQELATLLDELQEAKAAGKPVDAALAAETRQALATSQYYMTWLMRLEGQSRREWEPEINAARQNYRLLAEQSEGAERTQRQEDLEAAVRLARMELSELQGLPLPSQ